MSNEFMRGQRVKHKNSGVGTIKGAKKNVMGIYDIRLKLDNGITITTTSEDIVSLEEPDEDQGKELPSK